MPKVQGVLRKSGARDNRNVRHQSCEGCRRRKMKCSRTMPCIACEVRGQDCVWLDSKPTHGLLQPSLHETQAEIVRLGKVIKQLQALVAEKDGCPLPLPDDLVPPTPPHALDALPQVSPPSDPQQDFDLAAAVAHFGGASSSSTSAPSWVPSSWTRVDDGSAPSPSLPLEALPWARTHVDEPRQLYDSTVSYATLLANPVPALHGPLPGAAMAAASATTVTGAGSSPTVTSPSSWTMAHDRATTWPSPSSSRRGDFVVDSAFAPRSSSSSFSPRPPLSSTTLSYSHLAPLPLSPAPVSPPHRLPGRETISAMVHGVRVQAPPAAADALGLSIESTQGAGGSMRKMDALAWSLVMGSLAQ